MSPAGEPDRGPALDIGVFGARSIPSTYSGYETFLTAFLPQLVQRGHRVTMYTREREAVDTFEGVHRRYLPSITTKQLDTLTHGALSSLVSRFGHHDVVLACNVANAYFLPALTMTGVPTVLNVDGIEWQRDKWGTAARRVFRAAARISRHTATTLITDCDAMQEIYLREFGAQSVSIPYPHVELHDDAAPHPPLEPLGLTPGGYVMVAARHNPENNIVPIVESHLRTESPQPIAVLGTANYASPVGSALGQLAEDDDRVRLVGHVDDRALFGALLRHATVYFHGHSVGGINPSLIEAMGAQAFVAAYDTPFNREALGPDAVYFPDPSTAAEVAYQARARTDDARYRAALGDRVRSEFAMDDIVDRYESTLRAAATGRVDSVDRHGRPLRAGAPAS